MNLMPRSQYSAIGFKVILIIVYNLGAWIVNHPITIDALCARDPCRLNPAATI